MPEPFEPSKIVFEPGRPRPLGVYLEEGGVYFSVFSRHATSVWLALFNDDGDDPVVEYEMDASTHRFGDIWHAFVRGLPAGVRYMYRTDGPHKPEKGHRFDPLVYLLDPYARRIQGSVDEGTARCIVPGNHYDWQGDAPVRRPLDEVIIYEMHVKGFTRHPSSGVKEPGTYRAVMEKIPYLQDLGINAVELLPVHYCGERIINDRINPETGDPLTNYWGYQPIGYFAPDTYYAACPDDVMDEFRDMVAAFHRADIEVYVDVVFNHTAEYGRRGPTICFRGLDNAVYYHLDDEGDYKDFTGCGNSLNCNHPIVREMIIECLRYWVVELHIDGFRFDLACVLNRDRNGNLMQNSPLVEHLAEDPLLRHVKLIAEPWDLAGGHQLGIFGSSRWAEWNDHFRDDVRRFWRGDSGLKGDFAQRITGSPHLFEQNARPPQNGINFITAHDGFTLRDVVSYEQKHNMANGENNRDGHSSSFSWNCGVEGDTDDQEVNALRLRLQKSLIATLFLSLGVPMLTMGDEIGRTQSGNNNAYCQDNELSWLDWSLLETNAELHRFTRAMIALRRAYPVLSQTTFFTGRSRSPYVNPDILWFDAAGKSLNWHSIDLCLACRLEASHVEPPDLYIMFNPSSSSAEFKLPDGAWRVRINTAQHAPSDAPDFSQATEYTGSKTIVVGRKSLIVLAEAPHLTNDDELA